MHMVEAFVGVVEPKYWIISGITRNARQLTESPYLDAQTVTLRAVDQIAIHYINAIRRTITWGWCSIAPALNEDIILGAFSE